MIKYLLILTTLLFSTELFSKDLSFPDSHYNGIIEGNSNKLCQTKRTAKEFVKRINPHYRLSKNNTYIKSCKLTNIKYKPTYINADPLIKKVCMPFNYVDFNYYTFHLCSENLEIIKLKITKSDKLAPFYNECNTSKIDYYDEFYKCTVKKYSWSYCKMQKTKTYDLFKICLSDVHKELDL